MKRKATYKKMVKLFDKAWENYLADPTSFITGWKKTLEDNGWTDPEFDECLNEETFKNMEDMKEIKAA